MSHLQREIVWWAILICAAACFSLLVNQGFCADRDPAMTREFQRIHPCPSTGQPTGACVGWVKDHIIPLCKGGPDTIANLQWQRIEDAKAKDRWECR